MEQYFKYRPLSWQDLLRIVRNMFRHYKPMFRSMPALQQALGPKPQSVFRYMLHMACTFTAIFTATCKSTFTLVYSVPDLLYVLCSYL